MIVENSAALITASFAFVTATLTLFYTWSSNKKKDYIGLVTQERLNYICLIRQHFVDFASKVEGIPDNDISQCLKNELLKHKYELFMKLNPKCEKWDHSIMCKIENIINVNSKCERDKLLMDLVTHVQFLLKLEWEGLNEEVRKGDLSQLDKYLLRKRVYNEYEMYKK